MVVCEPLRPTRDGLAKAQAEWCQVDHFLFFDKPALIGVLYNA
jgi:hypothetical protein